MTRLDPRIRTALLSLDPSSTEPAWHGAPTPFGLLRGVGPEVALWTPGPRMLSIREIALHIAFWENNVANRLTGESVRMPFDMRKPGWPRRVKDLSADLWKEERRLVADTHRRLVAAVKAFDPRRLDEPLKEKTRYRAIEVIHGAAEHNLYHGAQIKMLKRLAKGR